MCVLDKEFSWPVYCRSYLITMGIIIGGLCVFLYFAVAREPDGFLALSQGWLLGLGIAWFIAIAFVLFGLAGPAETIEQWADLLSKHEIAFAIMLLAIPLYFALVPFYRRR